MIELKFYIASFCSLLMIIYSEFCFAQVGGYKIYGTTSYEQFGYSVSNAADVVGDSSPEFIVGSPYYNAGGNNSGKITVFNKFGVPIYTRVATMTNNTTTGRFGAQIIILDDIDLDGKKDFLVAAPHSCTTNQTHIPKIFLYSGQTGSVIYEINGNNGSDLGVSIASLGHIDNDNFNDFIVGAPKGWRILFV